MFTKLLAISGAARAGPPAHAGAGVSYFPAASSRYVPRLHAPLECRWRIDRVTGALSAVWLDPSAGAGTKAAEDPETIDARRWFAQSPQAAALLRR